MLKALIKAMRPRQWIKNIFIFAPLVFDKKLTDPTALLMTIAGAVLFSLVASSVYLINDISDVEADRLHPRKKHRPIASGALVHPGRPRQCHLLPGHRPGAGLSPSPLPSSSSA